MSYEGGGGGGGGRLVVQFGGGWWYSCPDAVAVLAYKSTYRYIFLNVSRSLVFGVCEKSCHHRVFPFLFEGEHDLFVYCLLV